MRIIISPAKKMITDTDSLAFYHTPKFIENTKILLDYMKTLSYDQLKSIWKYNDKIARLNYHRIKSTNLYSNLTPAILAYQGIQYQYMGSGVFQSIEYDYLDNYLRILSGFYGILMPFDGVVPYRLEMQAKLHGNEINSLYDFWGGKLADELFSQCSCIINLASKEYSDCIIKYLNKKVKFVTCIFGECIGNKIVEKGTLVKMARGEMVRYMAENQIKDIEEIKKFNRLNYVFNNEISNESKYVFVKKQALHQYIK